MCTQTSQPSIFGIETQYFKSNLNTSIPARSAFDLKSQEQESTFWSLKKSGSCQPKFGLLFCVAKVVMTIPHHSNASEGRPSSSSLKTEGIHPCLDPH